MNEAVVKVLNEQMWSLGTYGAEPNVVPVGFKAVLEDGRLAVGDVFLETTLANIQKNGKIAISAFDAKTMEGYQVKGTAEYVTEGAVVDAFKERASALFHGATTAKGALLITPEQVIVTTPGADNKKRL